MPKRAWRVCAVLCLLIGSLLAGLTPAASGAPERRAPASLTITPDENYVGGQALVFSGNIGASGERRVHLEVNQGYAGAPWGPIDGFSTMTEPDGDFRFTYPAPAMMGIRYRVASGDLATPGWTFEARAQDLTVTPVGTPAAGVPFELLVDTTPSLARRPDTIGLKPIPGRTLRLQEQVTPTKWKDLDTTEVGATGLAKFTVTESAGGVHVYRVVMANWFEGENKIGWFPSFPTYVNVKGLPRHKAPTGTVDTWEAFPVAQSPERREESSGDRTTASKTFQWGVSLFDFAWVFGESLSARPYRGLDPKGSWEEYLDGGGRVSSHNGGLHFDSKRENKPGPGDFGTTMATMRGNPMTYGRWEVRVRPRSEETGAHDYVVRAELVPEDPAKYDCGSHNITLGEMTAHGNSIVVGVNAGDRQWTHRTHVPGGTNNVHYALAVELTRKHITWFIDGKPVATLENAQAISGLPMTLRLSMVGKGQQEMNDTDVLADWQRGFSLLRGKQVTSGARLDAGKYDGGC